MQVQDACNLLGVTKSMATSIQELADALRVLSDETGTHDINTHPIAQLWAEKVADLCGLSLFATSSRLAAWDACYGLAGQKVIGG